MESKPSNPGGTLLETDESDHLISSEKVDGTAVYDTLGGSLGTVHHLMIDKRKGAVEYAVISFGGFLGIGESYSPLPWWSLTYETRLGGYVVNADRARLEQAPRYTGDADPDWRDPLYQNQINEYWMVTAV